MLVRNYSKQEPIPKKPSSTKRVSLWYGVLLAVFGLFLARLFYLQVIKHDFYQTVALSGQLKQYEIPAERGTIRAKDGSSIVPIVLNEKRFNVIADPKLIKDPSKTAELLAPAIGKPFEDVKSQLGNNSRYEILAKKLTKEQHEKVKALERIPRVTWPPSCLVLLTMILKVNTE
jgi:cell division protein FtsI/penicillin-binding protein 2